MPVITIKGIRVESLAINISTETGNYQIETAQYSLISSLDRVLAKQTIGGYQGVVVQPSGQTIKALNDFMELYRADVRAVVGLE